MKFALFFSLPVLFRYLDSISYTVWKKFVDALWLLSADVTEDKIDIGMATFILLVYLCASVSIIFIVKVILHSLQNIQRKHYFVNLLLIGHFRERSTFIICITWHNLFALMGRYGSFGAFLLRKPSDL